MIKTTNNVEQTLQPGGTLTMQLVHSSRRGCECFMDNTNSVRLTSSGTYEISWGGNIGGETAGTPVQVSITLGEAVLPGSTMISTPAAVTDRNSVSRTISVGNCCGDYNRVFIRNTGTVPVIIGEDSLLFIHRIS